MITIREIKDSKPKKFALFIDGNQVDARVGPGSVITVSNPAVVELLMTKPVSEITYKSLSLESFPGILEWWEGKGIKLINIDSSQKMNSYNLTIMLQASPLHWRRLWTLSEYKQEIESLLKSERYNDIITRKEDGSPFFRNYFDDYGIITFHFYVNQQETIGAEIARCSNILHEVHKEAEKRLAAKLRTDSVVMFFDFPVEVRAACEQYLLYFIEFLRDLGVEADAELKHDISGVLFSGTR